jgi:hypothetical protein
LGGLGLLIGIYMQMLDGLEAMITIQLAFLSILWLNQQVISPIFSQTYALKYSLGYSIPFGS